MSSKDAARRNLSYLVLEFERTLDLIDDPVERVAAADEVRADLAVMLTKAVRRSAWEAKTTGHLDRLSQESWRGRKYLLRLANQYAESNGLPNTLVRDIVTRRVLDLSDLARLRGQQR